MMPVFDRGDEMQINVKAQYETAQTLLWAMKNELESNEFSDVDFARKASEYAAQNAKVNTLRKEFYSHA